MNWTVFQSSVTPPPRWWRCRRCWIRHRLRLFPELPAEPELPPDLIEQLVGVEGLEWTEELRDSLKEMGVYDDMLQELKELLDEPTAPKE